MRVEFDKYSLIVDGERIVLRCGSIHYFRTLGEKEWYDRLSKMKAGGYNAVDIYFYWSFHEEKRGEYDFSGYKNVEIYARKQPYELEEVIEIVRGQLQSIDKEFLSGFINSNAGLHRNWAIKIVPLFIKSFVMKLCFKFWGEVYQTIAVSNLGVVQTPNGFDKLVESYSVNLGRPKYNAKAAGLVSFNGVMTWTFSSRIKEMTIEKLFFTTLSELGVDVTIESNRRDLYGE